MMLSNDNSEIKILMTGVVIFLLGFLSFFLTYFIRRYALRKRLLSIPNERSLHSIPTPIGGGLAIVIVWYLGITVMYFYGLIEKSLFFALLCGMVLTIVSIINDIKGLGVLFRLLFHFFTVLIALYFLGGLREFIIPAIKFEYIRYMYPLVIFGMVWFINLFNFMDGVDGFASLEAIVICLIMFLYSGNPVNLLLIASVLGFLYWNWPKAKIFMGDVGSTQLGFILVVLGIYFHNTYKFSILNWIMLSSPFWFDATLTLCRRWKRGAKFWEAHRQHAYQRIVQAGFSHLEVDLMLVAINLIIILLILLYREIKFMQIPVFIFTILFYYFLTRQVDKRMPFR